VHKDLCLSGTLKNAFLWDLSSPQPRLINKFTIGSIVSCTYVDDRYAIVGSYDRKARVWELDQATKEWNFKFEYSSTGQVRCLDVWKDILAVVSDGGTCVVVSLDNGHLITHFPQKDSGQSSEFSILGVKIDQHKIIVASSEGIYCYSYGNETLWHIQAGYTYTVTFDHEYLFFWRYWSSLLGQV